MSRFKTSVMLLALMLPVTILAQENPDMSVRAQCYDTLRDNLTEAGLFAPAMETLSTLEYETVNAGFTGPFRSLIAYDVMVDKPVFSSKIYTFGTQTGFTYPQVSTFPLYGKAEVWGPAKEYVIGEEYVTDNAGVEHFISCYFLQIGAEDLMAVTEDRYAYDAPGISLLKTTTDNAYKIWYGDNSSYDYNNEYFAGWRKMYVYPAATANDYFNKFAVADAQSAHEVSDFALLEALFEDYIQTYDVDLNTGEVEVFYYRDEAGQSTEDYIRVNPALLPIQPEGLNALYPYAEYYEAIEAVFPEFASLLSVRGSLKYSTFIELLSNPNLSPELVRFIEEFTNVRTIEQYYRERYVMENPTRLAEPELERLLPLLQNADWTVAQLQNGASFSTLVYSPTDSIATSTSPEVIAPQPTKTYQYVLVSGGAILILCGLVYFIRHRKEDEVVTE